MPSHQLSPGELLTLLFVTDFPEKTFSFRAINFPLNIFKGRKCFPVLLLPLCQE